MHNTTSYCLLTNVQAAPNPRAILPSFIIQNNDIRCKISLWSVGINCLGCAPSQLLVLPTLSADRAV